MLKIGILGSSGSIGTQTLDVIRKYRDIFSVGLLANANNKKLLIEQAAEFGSEINFCGNFLELCKSQTYNDLDIVVNGIVGLDGLLPTVAVLNSHAKLATANKESLVAAGGIIKKIAKMNNKQIIPIDSEHSAIFQCLQGESKAKTIVLTASGGAFRDYSLTELKSAKAKDALLHPTWKMGVKVTIDSATLVNKGMEIIEARHLFDTTNVEVLMHRESIIHSLVEFEDNSLKASLSFPDMAIPIQYALTYPTRLATNVSSLNLAKIRTLNFEEPDYTRFPCLKLAKNIVSDTEGTIFNATNQVAVNAYIQQKIGFYDIPNLISQSLEKFSCLQASSIEEILVIDSQVREYTNLSIINRR